MSFNASDHGEEEVQNAQLNQIRKILNENQVKLWLPPYNHEGDPDVAELLNLSQTLTTAIELEESLILEGLKKLQSRALERLNAKGLLENSGRLQLKLKPSRKVKQHLEENQIEQSNNLEVAKDAKGSHLAQMISEKYRLDPESLRLISAGKVVDCERKLDEQNVKPGQAVMVVLIDKEDDSLKVLNEQKSLLDTTKKDARLLGKNDPDSRFGLTIADQSGHSLDLPDEERSSLIIAMSLHEKGRSAIKKKNFSLALVLLLEADVEYGKVSSELVSKVDNYGLLNLDIAWCYVQMNCLSQLDDAVGRLQLCENSFEKSYGPNMERLMAVKGSTGSEKALYLRMHLLQAIAFYHSGNPAMAKRLMRKAKDEFKAIDVNEDSIEEVKAMGFSTREARIALRMTGGDVARATEYAQNKRIEMEKVRKEEAERREKRQKYGITVGGKSVNLGYMKTLQNMGFSEDYAMIALKQSDNDINQAIDLIQNQPDILEAALVSSVEDDQEVSSAKKKSPPHKKKKEASSKDAYKRLLKDVGPEFGDTEDHLDLDLEEEKKLMTTYSKYLNMD